MQQVHSQATGEKQQLFSTALNNYRAILDRKNSICNILQQTVDGLSNAFHRGDQKSPEDLIFELFKIPNKNEASIGKLLMVLKSYGLHKSDPRLRPMMEKIWEIEKQSEELDNEAKVLHFMQQFGGLSTMRERVSVLDKSHLAEQLDCASWSHFCSIIKEIYTMCAHVTEGNVATYIPQLARANSKHWGVSICTVDGQRVSFGDSKVPFCVQSVSKAFNYAIAASDLGADVLHQFVGQEPSGRLFNEICLDSKNKPHNPMVNSGAIIVTSLIQSKTNIADRFDYVLGRYRKIAGGQYVGFNNAVFLSERLTADRNCALAYYMKEYKCFPSETTSITDALDFYFQLCSLEANCESAAVMAATLANGGVCPLTEERCIDSRPCRDVLSLMYSCGMYDYSGQFSFHVGLPAKSGVSGAMIVVVPNLMGICLWSPPLDAMGNTCRGVAFCKVCIFSVCL
uniref:glutaminase n=1 Tax=Ditylenchus dipsaci TaxID=166011 RepID=A0A915DW06_9BILA